MASVIHIIDSDGVGGAQTILVDYFNNKVIDYKQFLFIYNKTSNNCFNGLNNKIKIIKGFPNKYINVLSFPIFYLFLVSFLIKNKINVINIHLPGTTILFTPLFIILRFFGINIFVSVYSNKSQLKPFFYKLYILCAELYCKAFIVLIYGQNELKNHTKKTIYFVPYWIDLPLNNNSFNSIIDYSLHKNESKSALNLISVWRISSDKMMDLYFDIIDEIEKKIEIEFNYFFIGGGNLMEEALDKKKENKWNNTFFTGYMKECLSFYENCDFYIAIHFFNHISITTYNAMRTGKIIISLDAEKIQKEKIKFINKLNGYDGLIISCKDNVSVLKAINQLSRNLKLKNRLISYLNNKLSDNDTLKNNFIQTYDSILNSKVI